SLSYRFGTPNTFVMNLLLFVAFFFSSRGRHTISKRDWSSDVCSSDLKIDVDAEIVLEGPQHLEPACGEGDIHLVGELTAHTPCRLRRRTGSGGVAFDEDDVLDSALGQMVGDRRPHHTRSDDDDRGAFGHRAGRGL